MEEFTRGAARRLAPRTAEQYAGHLDLFVEWLHGTERRKRWSVSVLEARLLEAFFDWLLGDTGRHGRPRTRSTARKYVATVELFWSWAWRHDDRFAGVPRPRSVLEELPAEPAARTIAPTWEEMDRCVGAAAGWQRQLATVLRYTGLRVDQGMRLLWSDLDLERAELRIRPELGKSRQEKRGRVVPVPLHLVEEVSTWGERVGFLVPCGRHDGPRAREARGRDLARAWRRAGVREEVWKAHPHHAFRKGYESGLLALGAPFLHVEHLIGHSIRGAADAYVDPAVAFELRSTVDLVPRIGAASRAVVPPAFPGEGTPEGITPGSPAL